VDIFGVDECWAGDDYIDGWLDDVNSWAAHRVGAFDFPLRYRLKDLCDAFGYSLMSGQGQVFNVILQLFCL
jgi:alpha-amylase